MQPTNKIGIYSLNNPFNSRSESLEQAYQESLKEKINFSLNLMLPRIKQVMTKTITEKVNGKLLSHTEKLSDLKKETSNLKKSFSDSFFNINKTNEIEEALNNLGQESRELNLTIKNNSNYFNNIQEKRNIVIEKKDKNENALENISSLLDHNIFIYSNLNQFVKNDNLINLKTFLMEKLKLLNFDPKPSSKEEELIENLKSSLNKIEKIQNYIGSSENIIETGENHTLHHAERLNFNKYKTENKTNVDFSNFPNYKILCQDIYK
jgi:hypothetical protein